MRDDELRRHMRALDADFEPDPRFADALFTRLSLESGRRRRGFGRPLVLLAAALLVVALGAGVALGSRILQLPLVADDSASPTRSQQVPSSSAMASPSEQAPSSPPSPASPSASEAPEIPLRPGMLPPGSIVTVTGDGLRLRSEPSTGASVIATMKAGDAVLISSSVYDIGPVTAEGYEWYPALYAGGTDVWPTSTGAQDASGWIAAGSSSEQFVRLADVTCPEGEPDIPTLLAMLPWERLSCFADTSFSIEGTYGCSACGGSRDGFSPTWLLDPLLGGRLNHGATGYVGVHFPPDVPIIEDGSIVRVTVHVNDAASSTCEAGPGATGTTRALDADALELWCRERLVVESYKVLGTDPNWPYL